MTILNTSKWLLKKVHRAFFLLFLSFYALVKPLDKRGNGAVVAIAFLSTALALYSTLLCNVTLAHIALKTGTLLTHDIALYYALYTSAAIGFAAFYYAYLTKIVSTSVLPTVKFGRWMTAFLTLFSLVFYFTSFFVIIVY
ncbi:hypothetical protein [Hymenobacter sp. UYCo722]|uniref:hypothetical protein n=1 Tax=Hymenobacter sp. UYCo722 TaxID=3156335 RepID=UPI00339623C0